MLEMRTTGDAALTGSVSSRSFRVSRVSVVYFAVTGLSSGTITIECQPNKDGSWVALDSTNLAFSADGFAYAIIGGVNLRATGASAATGGTLYVGIAGDFVHED